ncbi:hypothetical protein [uncultured Eubacterium sp.]|uniref:hypothetical protein n=1 Tax=uncultured Eubacterium sp. TaxID=165185 RepID=UPI003265508B
MEFILLSCGFKIVGIILYVMVYVVIRPFIQAAGSYVTGKQMTWKDAIKTAGKGALDGAFLNGIGHSIAGVRRILSNNKAGIKKFYVDETGSVKIDGVGGSKADVTTEIGYNAGDTQVRVDGDWTENDMKQALLGHPPRGRCWNMQKYSYYVFT